MSTAASTPWGCWIQDVEAAKFWHKVLTDLRNRGLRDILIACCDGLTGLPDAIRAVFPDTVVQTCVVHVIRNAMRFVSYGDRKKVAAGMRAIYTAPTLEAAEIAFKDFDKQFGTQYPAAVEVWRHAWAGSSGALPRRSPLRTGRARFPGIRLKQAQWCRGRAGVLGCRAVRVAGRSQRARGATWCVRSTRRVRCGR